MGWLRKRLDQNGKERYTAYYRDARGKTCGSRPRSGVNDVSPAPSMEMLGDCCDGLFGLCIRVAGSVDWGWRVEELAA